MDSDICYKNSNVHVANKVSGLGIRYIVCEMYLSVSQDDDGAFVHYFNSIREEWIKGLENQQVACNQEWDRYLDIKLPPEELF